MSLAGIFQPLLGFLASDTAATARAKWPKGPIGKYRDKHDISVADYVQWVKNVEESSALASATRSEVVQRIRRLYFSSPFTESDKGETAKLADQLIQPLAPYAAPPLTTDHVDQATLNGLFTTSTIRTARGIGVDIGHMWLVADMELAGRKNTAEGLLGPTFILDSELSALLSWSGDLGSALNEWIKQVLGSRDPDNPQSSDPSAKVLENRVKARASKNDLLGSLDGVILTRQLDDQDTLVVSNAIAKYYQDDALRATVARSLPYPNSARRFHHFFQAVKPTLPASGRSSSPAAVSVELPALRSKLESVLLDAVDDLIGGDSLWNATVSGRDRVRRAGQAEFEHLCENFAKFLDAGLKDGDAPWPPEPW